MTKNPFYKITIFVLLVGILYSPFSLIFETNKALAVFGVGDVGLQEIFWVSDPGTLLFYDLTLSGLGVIGTESAVTSGATSGSFTKTIWHFATKFAGQALKKLILDRLVDALIAYINRGYKGGIIQDWDQFLEEAKQGAVGMLAQETGLGFLCSPFNLQVQLALIPVPKFTEQMTCTLDKITGNIESFLNDFGKGNWIAYQELWYPHNNYYGATLIAWNEAKIREARAEKAARDEAVAGQGFLSFQKCDENGKNCRIVTPGRLAGEAAVSALIDIPANSIINADDIATYIGAIADAAINQLIKSGIDGLRSLGKTGEATKATTANPCAGLTGEAAVGCIGLKNLTDSGIKSDRSYLLNQIDSTLKPRQEAADLLTSAIEAQTELVDVLAACPAGITGVEEQLALEQGVLDELQSKFDDNQTFVEQLQEAKQTFSETKDLGSAIIYFNNVEPLLDPTSANEFLESAKTQQSEIEANVADELPSVKSQCGL